MSKIENVNEQPTAGEIVADDEQHGQPGIGARIKDAAKRITDAVSGERLAMTADRRIVRTSIPEKQLDRNGLLPMRDVGLLRRVYREAAERLGNARHAVALAEQRMTDLKKIAEQDGLGREWALLATPRPPEPAQPGLVRVRALQPFTRYYQRPISRELVEWERVCEGRDAYEMFQPLGYSAVGANHVLDVPKAMLDELVREGLAERVDPKTPKQLPDGRLIS